MITVKEAAQLIGCSEAYVRSACKRGVLGDAFSGGKGQRMTSVVFPAKLAEMLGKSVEEIEHEVRVLRE